MSITSATKFYKKGMQETVQALKKGDVMGALTNFAMKKISFDNRAAWNARLTSPNVRVVIKVQGRDLPHRNLKHTNAFCVLFKVPTGYTGCIDGKGKICRLPRPQEHEVGRTEVVRDTANPIFVEHFVVDYHFEEEQTYLLRVYDEDLGYTQNLSEHYFIGGLVFTLEDLFGRPTQKMINQIVSSDDTEASIVLQGREVDTARKFLEFRIGAKSLTTSDSVLSTVDPYYMVERFEEETKEWTPVWKSEVVLHDSNPCWCTASLSLLELCGGDLDSEVRVTFWESHSHHDEDEYLGAAEILVRDLAFHIPKEGMSIPVQIKKKVFFGAGNKLQKTGHMQILKSRLIDRPTFLQYLKGGCELDVMVAVDCEQSIDHADEKKAARFVHGSWLNNYQAALEKIGTLMECYSRTHHFQMWGFNAQSIEENENVFVMSDKVAGKHGLLKSYERHCQRRNPLVVRNVDSHLGPLITKAMYRAIQESEHRHCYSVLVVLTSGRASDLQSMTDSINRAATDAPISIVFIGCEDDNLDMLEHFFERNKIQRSISGIRISRECTTFTSFVDCDNDVTKVIADGFEEVPEQMVQRFFQGGVDPKVPPKVGPSDIINVHEKHHKKEGMKDTSKKSHHPHHDESERRHHHKKKHEHHSKTPERHRHHTKNQERGNHHKSPRSPDRGHKPRIRVKPSEIDF